MSSESSGGKAPERRVFFALWPDQAARDQLQQVVERLRDRLSARWVSQDNFHITLAFLGAVPETDVTALRQVEQNWPEPFVFSLERLCLRRRQMLWIAPRAEPPALQGLVSTLIAGLDARGVAPSEGRTFRTHLTLARRVAGGWRESQSIDPILWTVCSFCLVESVLDRFGAHYRPLRTWALRAMPAEASVE